MKKTKDIAKITKQVESILCNKCGIECYDTLIYKDIDGGSFFVYGAGTDLNCNTCMFDLCTKCILELISSFKYPPEID